MNVNYIGQNIRKERKKAGVDQEELAKTLKISQTAICRFEKGSRHPSVELLKRIAVALGCPFTELLNEEQEKSDNSLTKNTMKNKDNLQEDFLRTLLAQNADISEKLRSLAKRTKKLTPIDWQLLADHFMHTLSQAELLLNRKRK